MEEWYFNMKMGSGLIRKCCPTPIPCKMKSYSSVMSQPSLQPDPRGLLVGTNHQGLFPSFLFLILVVDPSAKIPADFKWRCSPRSAPRGGKSGK